MDPQIQIDSLDRKIERQIDRWIDRWIDGWSRQIHGIGISNRQARSIAQIDTVYRQIRQIIWVGLAQSRLDQVRQMERQIDRQKDTQTDRQMIGRQVGTVRKEMTC